jgi:UDP-N-acetylmuramyl pentapeptide phosphotransferase/UDP-N-acetylglucosamine-1-phosphate transferase
MRILAPLLAMMVIALLLTFGVALLIIVLVVVSLLSVYVMLRRLWYKRTNGVVTPAPTPTIIEGDYKDISNQP